MEDRWCACSPRRGVDQKPAITLLSDEPRAMKLLQMEEMRDERGSFRRAAIAPALSPPSSGRPPGALTLHTPSNI